MGYNLRMAENHINESRAAMKAEFARRVAAKEHEWPFGQTLLVCSVLGLMMWIGIIYGADHLLRHAEASPLVATLINKVSR